MNDFRGEPRGLRPAWPDRAIGALAGRQHTMITHAQLLGLGVDRHAIFRALDQGRLHPVHRAVYSLIAPAARPPLAAAQAALLACGPTAALSYQTAARLHGLAVPDDRTLHVSAAADRRRPGVRIHRVPAWGRGDRTRIGRLAVTTVPRVILDLAADLGDRPFEHLVDDALARGRTSRARLRAELDARPQASGRQRLFLLLDPHRPSSDTWSEPEERLLQMIRAGGLPEPELNGWVGPYRPDLLWREQQLIVEYDSDRHHSGNRRRYADARRHNDLTGWGFGVLHVTRPELHESPERILVWVATTLARAGR